MIFDKQSARLSNSIVSQEKLAVFLAFIAGYLDAAGLLKWKIYVSFMSGNTTQLGVAFFNGKSAVIATTLTVIGCFVLGIYSGTCLSLWKETKSQTIPFYIVAFLLIGYTAVSYYYPVQTLPAVAVIGFATGIMNTIVTAVGNQKINTDFVTGTLNSLARNTAMLSMSTDDENRKQYKENAIRLFLLWTGFLLGTAIAPVLLPFLKNWTFTLPAILLIVCAFLLTDFNFKTKSYVTEK
ncbi:YoaK family protein [Flavobacterium artemisiae]|uniref:YoaK family protein n=1 Tax=Flavobacterium artemisiae TaxID=2126556 RepID=A0ABW4HGX6_9FLAO